MIVSETIRDLKRRGVNASLANVVVTRTYTGPWTVSYVRFNDGRWGCGISNNEMKVHGDLSFLESLLNVEVFEVISQLEDVENSVFINSLLISIASTLSHNLMKEKILTEEGYKVRSSITPDLSALDPKRYVQDTDTVAMVGFHVTLTRQIANIAELVNVTELMNLEDLEVADFADGNHNVRMLPARKNEEVLRNADVVFITGQTLVNGTAEDLLKFSKDSRTTIIYGPTSSFYPKVLFEKGADVSFSLVLPSSPQFKKQFVLSRGWWQGIKGVKLLRISKEDI